MTTHNTQETISNAAGKLQLMPTLMNRSERRRLKKMIRKGTKNLHTMPGDK